MKRQNQLLTKIHLVISVVIVIRMAIIYGFQPDSSLNFQLDTIHELNQFKAMMAFI